MGEIGVVCVTYVRGEPTRDEIGSKRGKEGGKGEPNDGRSKERRYVGWMGKGEEKGDVIVIVTVTAQRRIKNKSAG